MRSEERNSKLLSAVLSKHTFPPRVADSVYFNFCVPHMHHLHVLLPNALRSCQWHDLQHLLPGGDVPSLSHFFPKVAHSWRSARLSITTFWNTCLEIGHTIPSSLLWGWDTATSQSLWIIRENPLFQAHPDTLQVQLFYDDMEVVNALGTSIKHSNIIVGD